MKIKQILFLPVLWLALPIVIQAQPILYTLGGDGTGDYFGHTVGNAGDINNDGYSDVIIGATLDDNSGQDSGSAKVFSGANGSILYAFNGDGAGDRLGNAVSGAGDVNNDGYSDVIVGAPFDDNTGSNSGSAHVFSGHDGSTLYTFNGDSSNDRFGMAVSGLGDVDGDGYMDVIVGAYKNTSSYARVFSGFDGGILYTFIGGSYYGYAVDDAQDVNRDGYTDIIVGAYNQDYAQVFSGIDGGVLYTFNGDSANDWFGRSVSGVGDVNGDNYPDLIVGAAFDDNNGIDSGSVRVFSGIDGSILYTLNGDDGGDRFGHSTSGVGDVNGDGYSDFIVGAYQDDHNGYDAGSARVFSGINGSILYTLNGNSTGDIFGLCVSDAGDVNNDGYSDIVVGGVGDDNSGVDFGSARVFSGAPMDDASYDFDRDGDGDILMRNTSTGQNEVWILQNGAKSSAKTLTANALTFEVVGILDGDADGDSDILWYDSVVGQLIFWRMENGLKQANAFLGNTTATLDGTGDFDGDGDVDILLKTALGDVKIWTIENMAHVLTGNIGAPGGTYQVIDTGDFNGDGIDDIVMQNGSGAVRIWQLNNSAQLASTINVATVAAGYALKKVGDTDNDGDDDLIFRNDVTGQTVVWVMQNGARVQISTVSGLNPAMDLATVTDFDKDGDEDLMFRDVTPGDASDGDTIVWKMQDNIKQSNSFLGNNAVTFLLESTLDMDGDGDYDILYRDSTNGQIIGWNMENGAKAGNYSLGNPGISWEPRF